MGNDEPELGHGATGEEDVVQEVVRRKKPNYLAIVLSLILLVMLAGLYTLFTKESEKKTSTFRSQNRYLVALVDGTIVHACCDAGIATLQAQLGDKVASARTIVEDVGALKPSEGALYVYGSDKTEGCSPSAYSFWTQEGAKQFQAEHGGEIIDWKELVKRRAEVIGRPSVSIIAPMDEHGEEVVEAILEKLAPYKDEINVNNIDYWSELGQTASAVYGNSLFFVVIDGKTKVEVGGREVNLSGYPKDYPCPCMLAIGPWETDELVDYISQEYAL